MTFTFTRLSDTRWEPPLVGTFYSSRDLCGVSMNDGLLRFHDAASGAIGQEFVDETFGLDGLRADVFAHDWRARQFAVTDTLPDPLEHGLAPGEPAVLLLDCFDMSITPWVSLPQFEVALGVPMARESLHESLFREWLTANELTGLAFDRCAGASVPGFYRGPLAVDNLPHDKTEVYLSFVAQLWAFAKTQQPGDPPPHLLPPR